MANGGRASEGVTFLIEQIESLEAEKRILSERIRDFKATAKDQGIDVKALNYVIKLRRMDPGDRSHFEASVDQIRALIGDLGGTPLGEAAIERFETARKMKKSGGDAAIGQSKRDGDESGGEQATPQRADKTHDDTPEVARDKGREAGKSGASVRDNPYLAHDPCRGAWDEGWVQGSGLTGLEMAKAWERPKKKKGADDAASSGSKGSGGWGGLGHSGGDRDDYPNL